MSHNPARSCLATLAMLVGLAPAMALAQTQAASHRSGAELTAAIDSIADSLVSGPLVGMSVVVARGPELLLAKGYGLADQEANRLVPLASQCVWLREAGFVDVVAPFRWYELAVFGGYRGD